MDRFSQVTEKSRVPSFLRFLILLGTFGAIMFIFPLTPQFQYEYQQGQPWAHEDLQSPVTFPIEKPEEEIEEEKQQIIESFLPFYVKEQEVAREAINNFEGRIQEQVENEEEQEEIIEAVTPLIENTYQQNIIKISEEHQDKDESDEIRIVEGRVTTVSELGELWRIEEARERLIEESHLIDELELDFIRNTIREIIEPNVTYDEELSEQELQERLEGVAETRGVIESGEVIIRQGEIVTEEKVRILESLETEYQQTIAGGDNQAFVTAGYGLVIGLLFLMFYLYIFQFHNPYIYSYRALILIMVNIVLFLLLSVYVIEEGTFSIYVVPFCVVPIILIAFFSSRLAFITHLIIVLLVGLLVSNPFEFFIVQFVAGFTATLSMMQARYLSQFFGAVLATFAAYCASYLGLNLIQTGSLVDINFYDFGWFVGNFVLTLLAYPLIYAYEKIFGFVSDITLLELGDVNNKLLKELSLKAPGSFQHSLQVANLSEAIINQLDGNALLARVASLYHDIGKMNKPEFFIENQQYMNNPHDELTPEESCREIINHVRHGAEMARKEGLPDQITDIIRTHHGTSRLEFFYRNEINKYSEEEVDETQFRYPGPKPRTKEEAVIMIIDSVEAASRSLDDHTAEAIDQLIERIVDSKVKDNQFDDADITMSEIKQVKAHLKKLLKGLYHVRIKYPEDDKSKKAESGEVS